MHFYNNFITLTELNYYEKQKHHAPRYLNCLRKVRQLQANGFIPQKNATYRLARLLGGATARQDEMAIGNLPLSGIEAL